VFGTNTSHFFAQRIRYFGFFGIGENTVFDFQLDKLQLCPNECSGPTHGSCVGSGCRCTRDYYTSDCGTFRRIIEFGVQYTGIVTANSWNFYSVNANSANTVVIKVKLLEIDHNKCSR
jgi:hypothetical protein